ncbi:hypothetical protein THAOC_12653, partial [Thalassiosira oceanica]
VAAAVLVRREGAGQRTTGPAVARGEADGEGIRRAARRTSLLRAPAGPVMEGGGGGGDVALDEVQELGGRDGLVVAHLSGYRQAATASASTPPPRSGDLAYKSGRPRGRSQTAQTGSLPAQSPDITRSRAPSYRSTCLAANANPSEVPPSATIARNCSQANANLIMMRCVPCEGDGDESCANCGKLESDAVKLKNCTACRLVKYCGVDCQRAHRKKHKKACKQRAVAELKDEQLYSQGLERPEGDFCPICTLPIPFRMDEHSSINVCCMKRVCNGCNIAAQKRGMFDCAFCRTPVSGNNSAILAMIQTRVAKKDLEAINFLGDQYYFGDLGLPTDMQKAVELWEEAAELGYGVQQDKAKGAEFYTKAAVQGHAESRYNLGCYEEIIMGNHDRAVRHFLISAKMGDKSSVEKITKFFMAGLATREQYAEALKGYQGAVEEMKSHDRDEAKAFLDNRNHLELHPDSVFRYWYCRYLHRYSDTMAGINMVCNSRKHTAGSVFALSMMKASGTQRLRPDLIGLYSIAICAVDNGGLYHQPSMRPKVKSVQPVYYYCLNLGLPSHETMDLHHDEETTYATSNTLAFHESNILY